MTITIPEDVRRDIEQRVASGQYQSAEQVLEAMFAALRQHENRGDFEPGELNALADEGEASGEPLDAKTVFAELRQRLLAGKSA